MPTVCTEVEVDVELADFDTEDLIQELQQRGDLPPEADHDAKEIVQVIHHKRRCRQNYESELDQLIWQVLGKIV